MDLCCPALGGDDDHVRLLVQAEQEGEPVHVAERGEGVRHGHQASKAAVKTVTQIFRK